MAAVRRAADSRHPGPSAARPSPACTWTYLEPPRPKPPAGFVRMPRPIAPLKNKHFAPGRSRGFVVGGRKWDFGTKKIGLTKILEQVSGCDVVVEAVSDWSR